MDKEFIKKYNLSEAVKRFQQINEYTLLGDQKLNEVGEDDMNDPNAQGQQQGMQQGGQMQPQMGGMQGGQQDMQQDPNAMGGGDPSMMGGDPNAMGGDPNAMGGDPNAMGGDPNAMGGDPGMMGGDPNAMGGDPNAMGGEDPGMMGGDPGMMDDPNAMGDPNVDTMQPDDEVIDVDELTQSQETTEYKIDGVNDKLTQLLQVNDQFLSALKQSEEKIEALKAEIERRNPTDTEKMNIRSQASYPYSEFPRDYWDKKSAENPHYDITYNNDVSPAKEQEFMLKSSDIKGLDDRKIGDSFEYPMKLKDVLDYDY